MTGRVFDIQHFCTHDGPGVRTTVFLQGCPLRCVWCHNPESQKARPLLAFSTHRCIGCGDCVTACELGVHGLNASGERTINRAACLACGGCVEACPAEALEIVGQEMTVEQVMADVMKDAPFYANSGGGVTLSGGEPLAQPAFTLALLQEAGRQGLHRCLDTSGFGRTEDLVRIAEEVELVLFDIKELDPQRHAELTGVDNALILANLDMLAHSATTVRIRLPLIPGLNVSDDHFAGLADLFRKHPTLREAEIVPYHDMGVAKADRYGLAPGCRATNVSDEQARAWHRRLGELGLPMVDHQPFEAPSDPATPDPHDSPTVTV